MVPVAYNLNGILDEKQEILKYIDFTYGGIPALPNALLNSYFKFKQ